MDKLQPIMILLSILVGVGLSTVHVIENYAGTIVMPALMLMLYGIFLTVPFREFISVLHHKRIVFVTLIINFVWTPLLAFGLGWIFLAEQPMLWVGFVMLMVTPCTDWYLVFTKISKGNIALSSALLPINLLIQLLLLPLYIYVFFDNYEFVGMFPVVQGVLLVFLIPLLLAGITRLLSRVEYFRFDLKDKAEAIFIKGNIVFLCIAVIAIFASEASVLMSEIQLVLLMVFPLLIFFASNFVLGSTLSRRMKLSHDKKVSLIMVTLARNSPIALAIAVVAFPEEPVIVLALMIGPLIELPILALVARVLMGWRD